KQRRSIAWHLAAVARHHGARTLPQSLRPAWVSQPTPSPHGISLGGCRQVTWSGPPRHPLAPYRLDTHYRSLLQHDLADQHPPWRAVWAPPRQVSGSRAKPLHHLRHAGIWALCDSRHGFIVPGPHVTTVVVAKEVVMEG